MEITLNGLISQRVLRHWFMTWSPLNAREWPSYECTFHLKFAPGFAVSPHHLRSSNDDREGKLPGQPSICQSHG